MAKLPDTGNDYHLRIERRDATGVLIEEELHQEFTTSTLGRLGTGHITYEPNSGTFLYVYNHHNELRVRLMRVDATGAVQQAFYLDDGVGYDPQLSVMDGKIALTWSRATGRYLAFLSCSDTGP